MSWWPHAAATTATPRGSSTCRPTRWSNSRSRAAGAVHARPRGNPEERARLWPQVTAAYKGYAGYQKKTDREIPLVLLEPTA